MGATVLYGADNQPLVPGDIVCTEGSTTLYEIIGVASDHVRMRNAENSFEIAKCINNYLYRKLSHTMS